MYYAHQRNGSDVSATLCLCRWAPGTGPAADPDSQGHPTTSSQVDPFIHQDDPYETTEGSTGRFPPRRNCVCVSRKMRSLTFVNQ